MQHHQSLMRSTKHSSGLDNSSQTSYANNPTEDVLVRCDLGVLRPRVGATTYTLQLVLYPPEKKKKVFRNHISKSGIQMFDVDDPIRILFKFEQIYCFEVTTPDLDYEVPDGYFHILHKDVANCIQKTGIYTHACSVIGDADQEDISFDVTYYHKAKTRFYSKDRITYLPAKPKPKQVAPQGNKVYEEVQKSTIPRGGRRMHELNPKMDEDEGRKLITPKGRSSAGPGEDIEARHVNVISPREHRPLPPDFERMDSPAGLSQKSDSPGIASRNAKSPPNRTANQGFDNDPRSSGFNHVNVSAPISTKSILENLRNSGFDIVPVFDSPTPAQRRAIKYNDTPTNFILSPSPARGADSNPLIDPSDVRALNSSHRRQDFNQGQPPPFLPTGGTSKVKADTKRYTYQNYGAGPKISASQETDNFPPY